jgi:hypothetical protein
MRGTMSQIEKIPIEHHADADRRSWRDPFSSPHRAAAAASSDPHIAELQIENSRLQRLVAELLAKNQQLRSLG